MKDRETRNLKVVLTQKELQDKGKLLARANRNIEEREAQKKSVNAQIKADIDRNKADVLSLSGAIQNGFEWRDVECSWIYDWTLGEKFLIRDDTGEEIDRQMITNGERQQHLDFERAERKKHMKEIKGGKNDPEEEPVRFPDEDPNLARLRALSQPAEKHERGEEDQPSA